MRRVDNHDDTEGYLDAIFRNPRMKWATENSLDGIHIRYYESPVIDNPVLKYVHYDFNVFMKEHDITFLNLKFK